MSLTRELIDLLEGQQSRELPGKVETAHDAILIYGGMGPSYYVTRAGKMLIGADEDWGVPVTREVTEDEWCTIIVGAAHRFQIPELLKALPTEPVDSRKCQNCCGDRWEPVRGAKGEWPVVICRQCFGRGWES